MLDLTVEQLLTTTRSVRKRLDLTRPVPLEVITECLELAIQAPTGSNSQGWKFLVITCPEQRKVIGEYYARSFQLYAAETARSAVPLPAGDPRAARLTKVVDSAVTLAGKFSEVPVHILACLEGRVEKESVMVQASFYGSILPAAWSLMLALRRHGLGTAWTTLHLRYEKEIAELLGIPAHYTQAVLFPVAYTRGTDFRPAARLPVSEVTYGNGWGRPLA